MTNSNTIAALAFHYDPPPLKGDLPAAVQTLNFAGQLDDDLIGQPMGPNTLNETLWVVAVDRHEHGTRVGLSYVRPPHA